MATQNANVRVYPDGSLRTPDGKFASVSGMPAPGTANAQAFADHLSANGVDVVGTEMEVQGPLGIRRYDIVTRNADNSLFGIEVKSGGASLTPYQEFSDMYCPARCPFSENHHRKTRNLKSSERMLLKS